MAIDPALWETHRPRIEQLHYELRLPLREVMAILAEEEGFTPSEKSYKRQFTKWNAQDPEYQKSKRFK
jgi:hypothetical protein